MPLHPFVMFCVWRFRFIANNLLVEVTSTKALARLFLWALKRQMLISFLLYCAGGGKILIFDGCTLS